MNTTSAKILVVDDEEVIRYTLQKKLSRLGYNVISVEKAENVIYLIKQGEDIDLIITDIKLGRMDGIELLRRVSALEDPIPVLIITGHGNVEDAIKALRFGARDFIRKPFDINEVASSVRTVLRRKKEKLLAENFAQYMTSGNQNFRVPVDGSIINSLSYHLTKDLVPVGICNRTTAENLALALQEAISNAMFHGNLEIPSGIREDFGIKGYNEEIEKRKNDEKYSGRMVDISYELTRDHVEYTIIDEGPGFDHSSLPDSRDPENFFKNSGRGLLIIRIHMDEVHWNEKGNSIRLRKYRINNGGNGQGEV